MFGSLTGCHRFFKLKQIFISCSSLELSIPVNSLVYSFIFNFDRYRSASNSLTKSCGFRQFWGNFFVSQAKNNFKWTKTLREVSVMAATMTWGLNMSIFAGEKRIKSCHMIRSRLPRDLLFLLIIVFSKTCFFYSKLRPCHR